MRWHPKGYGGERRDPEQIKREGWREQGVLVVAEDDQRLTWPERELIRQLGVKLFGLRPATSPPIIQSGAQSAREKEMADG